MLAFSWLLAVLGWALHCRNVRLGGVSLPKVGRLFANSCFVASMYVSSLSTPVYLSSGVSMTGLGKNFIGL